MLCSSAVWEAGRSMVVHREGIKIQVSILDEFALGGTKMD